MRNAFAKELLELAEADPRIMLLSGDIGNRLFDPFKGAFPERFINCGVAEANMIGMAAGLALKGLRPVVYTITPFVTTRCLEQIRVDLCYHNLPVVVVGVGAGLSYASLGPSHHACEDIALLRSLPNMNVCCPGDALEVRALLRAALKNQSPLYLRLGKKNEPLIHESIPELEIGKAYPIRQGKDICLLSTGNLLPMALETAEKIEAARDLSVSVISFHTVKPLDQNFLAKAFASYQVIASLEEHSLLGGFGSAVSEWRNDTLGPSEPSSLFLRFGTPDKFLLEAGEQSYLRQRCGLTPEAIAEKILAQSAIQKA